MTLYPNLILDALKNVKYPGNGKSLAENDMIEDDIRIDGNKVSFSLIFDRPTDPFIRSVVRAAEAAVNTYISPEVEIKGNIAVKYRKPIEEKPELLPGVKNIVGISSGKGGVGKSTVAANVAISLASMGYKVGLLDADIFGPSMPKMFGVEDEQLYMVKKDGRDWIELGGKVWGQDAVDWFCGRQEQSCALEGRHGEQCSQAAYWRRMVGRPRLFSNRHAPRHERHSSDFGADASHHRGGGCVYSAGGGIGRCP